MKVINNNIETKIEDKSIKDMTDGEMGVITQWGTLHSYTGRVIQRCGNRFISLGQGAGKSFNGILGSSLDLELLRVKPLGPGDIINVSDLTVTFAEPSDDSIPVNEMVDGEIAIISKWIDPKLNLGVVVKRVGGNLVSLRIKSGVGGVYHNLFRGELHPHLRVKILPPGTQIEI